MLVCASAAYLSNVNTVFEPISPMNYSNLLFVEEEEACVAHRKLNNNYCFTMTHSLVNGVLLFPFDHPHSQIRQEATLYVLT